MTSYGLFWLSFFPFWRQWESCLCYPQSLFSQSLVCNLLSPLYVNSPVCRLFSPVLLTHTSWELPSLAHNCWESSRAPTPKVLRPRATPLLVQTEHYLEFFTGPACDSHQPVVAESSPPALVAAGQEFPFSFNISPAYLPPCVLVENSSGYW